MTPAVRAIIAASAVFFGGLLLASRASGAFYAIMLGAGLVVGALVVYYLVATMGEEVLQDLFAQPASPAPTSVERTKPLPRAEAIILEWADECLKQGDEAEAARKLQRINPMYRNHPQVLQATHAIHKQVKNWQAALDAAKAYTATLPEEAFGWIEQARCLEELGRNEEALQVLLTAAENCPLEYLVFYKIARHLCRAGRLPQAHRWLVRAFETGGRDNITSLALLDAALEPLWPFLRQQLVEKIVSGGQTGADRAALDFALAHDIPHGGWCPKGRLSQDGTIPKQYLLKETPKPGYVQRTEWNVRDSDGTVIFSIAEPLSGGTLRTLEFASSYQKPVLQLHRNTQAEDPGRRLRDFLLEHKIKVLNVAGPNATSEPEVGDFVRDILEQALFYRLKEVVGAAGAAPKA